MLTSDGDDQGTETHGGCAHHPSEKQKQLEYEQWEASWHHDAKAQKTHECHHLHQLTEQGSKNNTDEEAEEDDQSSIDGKDTPFTNHVVMTKLSGATNERLPYHDSKIPKSLSIVTCEEILTKHKKSREMCVDNGTPELWGMAYIMYQDYVASDQQSSRHKKTKETHREIVSTDDEALKGLHWTSQSSSNHQSSKHKSRETHADHRTPELEETACITYSRVYDTYSPAYL
ncbi:hypothetical protein F5141DRAFT_1213100 [Pisolithus sp. B1]|nr:hypothetical protein F5141DRAFT_1213100 [Pisolithus sp. B1]